MEDELESEVKAFGMALAHYLDSQEPEPEAAVYALAEMAGVGIASWEDETDRRIVFMNAVKFLKLAAGLK